MWNRHQSQQAEAEFHFIFGVWTGNRSVHRLCRFFISDRPKESVSLTNGESEASAAPVRLEANWDHNCLGTEYAEESAQGTDLVGWVLEERLLGKLDGRSE